MTQNYYIIYIPYIGFDIPSKFNVAWKKINYCYDTSMIYYWKKLKNNFLMFWQTERWKWNRLDDYWMLNSTGRWPRIDKSKSRWVDSGQVDGFLLLLACQPVCLSTHRPELIHKWWRFSNDFKVCRPPPLKLYHHCMNHRWKSTTNLSNWRRANSWNFLVFRHISRLISRYQ